MEVAIKKEENAVVVMLKGRLDTLAAPDFDRETAILTSADGGGKDIVIDCTGLEYISSSGLRSFISLLKASKAQGRGLVLTHLSPAILSIFEMTGFSGIFNIKQP